MDSPSSTAHAVAESGRAFTLKALLVGLAGTALVALITNLNDETLGQTRLIGNHLPVGPITVILLVSLLWNPACGLASWAAKRMGMAWTGRQLRRGALSTRELAVALALMLMTSWLPSSSFFRYFHRALVLPYINEPSKVNWAKTDCMSYLPPGLAPLGGDPERAALREAVRTLDGQADPAALRLLSLCPPAVFAEVQDAEQAQAQRALVGLRMARAQAMDPQRWTAAAALLDTLPGTLVPADPASAWAVAWQKVRERYRERLPALRREAEIVYGAFIQGLSDSQKKDPGIPWGAWLRPMAYWTPLVVCFVVAIIALYLVLHRQWAHHEQLTYPLATVTTALIERQPGRVTADIFSQKLFWFGFLPVVGIYLVNYAAVWFPTFVPRISLEWWYRGELANLFPVIDSVPDHGVSHGRLYFLVVGIVFFIPSEISLSVGLASPLLVLLSAQVFLASGQSVDHDSAKWGAYLGYAAILLFTGRTYYWAVVRNAIGWRTADGAALREPVWAARIFLAAFAAFTAVLCLGFGLDWLVALVYALLLMLFFAVFTRVICETGLPFLQASGLSTASFMANTLGFGAIGPGALVMVMYLHAIFTVDPRECLMPYVATSARMADHVGIRRGRLVVLGFAAILFALVVGFIGWTAGLYGQGSTGDAWANGVPARALDSASSGIAQLAETGRLETSAATSGLAKIPLVGENIGHSRELGWTAFGLAAVVLFALLRFRFSWWPLHPVLFLVWGIWPMWNMWVSFLIGWAVKVLVVRFGGGRGYNQLKPLFLGLICGEMAAVCLTIVFGFAYYLWTGVVPRSLGILPG